MAEEEVETHDLTDLAAIVGATDKQRRFCERLLAGMSQTEAAFGIYSGARNSSQLRSAASSAAIQKPTLALLALAESRGLGVPNAPGDRQELRRILWSHARSRDKQSSIRAVAEISRLDEQDSDGKPGMTPEELVREMLAYGAGVGIVASLYLDTIKNRGRRLKLAGLPLFAEMAPIISREYPDIWSKIILYVDEYTGAQAAALAAGAPVSVESLAVPRKEPAHAGE
jgi:hypothetical protein